MIRDAAMSHTDLSIQVPNLKKVMEPLDMVICKITPILPPSFSVPDQLSHLLNFLLTFHGTTGRTKHLQTFTKLSEIQVSSLHIRLRQGKYIIPWETNR